MQIFPRTSTIKTGEFFSETLPLDVAIPVGITVMFMWRRDQHSEALSKLNMLR